MTFIDIAAEDGTPTYERLFAHRPEVYEAWQQLNLAVRSSMELQRYELVTLAAARRLRSSYCMLAHGSVLLERFLDAEALRAVALDHHAADLSEVEVAVMDFADKVVADATSVTQEDVDPPSGVGSDRPRDLRRRRGSRHALLLQQDPRRPRRRAGREVRRARPVVRETLTVGRPIVEPA